MTATNLTDLNVSGTVSAANLTGTLDGDVKGDVQVASADGAISIKSGTVIVTKGTAAALTLADPASSDTGKELHIVSTTAAAHTVTIAGGLNGAGASADVGTFGAAAGNYVRLVAYNAKWYLQALLNVTFA